MNIIEPNLMYGLIKENGSSCFCLAKTARRLRRSAFSVCRSRQDEQRPTDLCMKPTKRRAPRSRFQWSLLASVHRSDYECQQHGDKRDPGAEHAQKDQCQGIHAIWILSRRAAISRTTISVAAKAE